MVSSSAVLFAAVLELVVARRRVHHGSALVGVLGNVGKRRVDRLQRGEEVEGAGTLGRGGVQALPGALGFEDLHHLGAVEVYHVVLVANDVVNELAVLPEVADADGT